MEEVNLQSARYQCEDNAESLVCSLRYLVSLLYCVKTYVSDGQDDGRVVYFVQCCERNRQQFR